MSVNLMADKGNLELFVGKTVILACHRHSYKAVIAKVNEDNVVLQNPRIMNESPNFPFNIIESPINQDVMLMKSSIEIVFEPA